MPAAMQAKGFAPDEPARRTVDGRCVLLVVGVKDEDLVHRVREDRVHLVVLGWNGEAHAQEVRSVVEVVARVNEGLADVVLIGHRGDGGHLGDHAHGGDHALLRVGDVCRVVVEGGHRADDAHHHGHRMRVAAETVEQAVHLVVDHRVMRDRVVEVRLLLRGRQLAVKEQVAGLEEVASLGELLDRVAAVEEHALVAVDIGDLGFAGRGGGEAWIEGKAVGLGVERADIDDRRTDGSIADLELEVLLADLKVCGVGHVGSSHRAL